MVWNIVIVNVYSNNFQVKYKMHEIALTFNKLGHKKIYKRSKFNRLKKTIYEPIKCFKKSQNRNFF